MKILLTRMIVLLLLFAVFGLGIIVGAITMQAINDEKEKEHDR